MKKKYLFTAFTVLILIIIGGGIYMILLKNEKVGTFELTDYTDKINYYVNYFPVEKVPELLDPIDSYKEAKEKAEFVWEKIYGESVKKKKPYGVLFDDKNQVWLVQGTLPKNRVGGIPHILLQKSDGKVLAVWYDK